MKATDQDQQLLKDNIIDAMGRAYRLAMADNWVDARHALQEATLSLHSRKAFNHILGNH